MAPVQLVQSRDTTLLLPILCDAEEGDDRVVWAIEDPAMTAYIVTRGDTNVGAVVKRWAHAESKIVYIATLPSLHDQG
jgi:hypothetical protein